jgi:hypothetical protein
MAPSACICTAHAHSISGFLSNLTLTAISAISVVPNPDIHIPGETMVRRDVDHNIRNKETSETIAFYIVFLSQQGTKNVWFSFKFFLGTIGASINGRSPETLLKS